MRRNASKRDVAAAEPAATTAPVHAEGHLDDTRGGVLSGWAWFPARPELAAVIEVRSGTDVLVRALAHLPREDLRVAGKRGGACAFRIPLSAQLEPGRILQVVACLDGATCALEGGTVELDAAACMAAGERATRAVDVLPVPLTRVHDVVGTLDHFGPDGLAIGWVHRRDDPAAVVSLVFREHGLPVLEVEADQWRQDLAELRQGDGSCGFRAAVPDSLRDGRLHELDICLADDGRSLLHKPIGVRLAPPAQGGSGASSTASLPAPLQRESRAPELDLSVVVVFYNMRREAERTLTSLGAAYQRDVDGLAYEVLCVDNGSDPPLDPDWIERFGPQFRLLRPTRLSSSPCAAINAAALQARGRNLAIMIDGAHVLTPGVFHEAMAALEAEPDAVIAVRHWFVGGDQRWLSESGYSRDMEDRLFRRIHWPRDGYQLFRVGAPITESPDPWFDWLNESNCLFVPTELFDRIGGIDAAFSEPGGGFANLDLVRRAEAAAPGKLICLIGEATFHQYHQGTTTNVADRDKDAHVRAYASRYRRLRGREFEGIDRNRLRFRGSLRNDQAIAIRQRPLMPMTLGVTGRVRRGNAAVHFDEGAQTYLQSVYAESGMCGHTRWLGRALDLAPADLVNLQEIIGHLRPARIVVIRDDSGLLGFLDSMLALYGLHDARIVQVLAQPSTQVVPDRVRTIVGDPSGAATLQSVERMVGAAEVSLVLFRPDPDDAVPMEALADYARFVSFRSYMVFMGTVFGQPWLGYSSRWYRTAVRRFVARHPDFVVEHSRDRHMLTACASGYLRRVGGRVTLDSYDASLNELESV